MFVVQIIRLHERVKESLTNQDTESTRQTLDEWLNAINMVQERRRQEIDNAAEKCRSGEPRLPDEKGPSVSFAFSLFTGVHLQMFFNWLKHFVFCASQHERFEPFFGIGYTGQRTRRATEFL